MQYHVTARYRSIFWPGQTVTKTFTVPRRRKALSAAQAAEEHITGWLGGSDVLLLAVQREGGPELCPACGEPKHKRRNSASNLWACDCTLWEGSNFFARIQYPEKLIGRYVEVSE